MAQRLKFKHPRLVRWSHWINGPVLLIMIISGLQIYWAYDTPEDSYKIRIGDWVLFQFFPEWFYNSFGLKSQLATGMAWHFFFMWFFLINGLIYATYTAVSGEWRDLLPNRRTPRQAFQTVLHDMKIRKAPPEQDGKFNGAQRLAYTGTVSMGLGSVLTGLAIWKAVQLGWLTSLLGGYENARALHFILMIGYVLFFVIHVAQVAKAGWNNFRAMVTGYELVPDQEVVK